MENSIVYIAIGLCYIVNIALVYRQSSRDRFVNPIGLLLAFVPGIGTALLLFIELVETLNNKYK